MYGGWRNKQEEGEQVAYPDVVFAGHPDGIAAVGVWSHAIHGSDRCSDGVADEPTGRHIEPGNGRSGVYPQPCKRTVIVDGFHDVDQIDSRRGYLHEECERS